MAMETAEFLRSGIIAVPPVEIVDKGVWDLVHEFLATDDEDRAQRIAELLSPPCQEFSDAYRYWQERYPVCQNTLGLWLKDAERERLRRENRPIKRLARRITGATRLLFGGVTTPNCGPDLHWASSEPLRISGAGLIRNGQVVWYSAADQGRSNRGTRRRGRTFGSRRGNRR